MELKYIVLTIIKILISVPAVLLLHSMEVHGAALMGGHLDNNNNSTNTTNSYILNTNQNSSTETSNLKKPVKEPLTQENGLSQSNQDSEEIPNPSPLVVPGYNLPENIFNQGKPFYLERDPLTGQIDFESKMSSLRSDDQMYDYIEDEPNSDIYNKDNIDRKDGSISGHRPSDVNQLTPNFHDFLNLPVKYNPDKYVYPLISSSYANTKVQGNINKYHNHKTYDKSVTSKPTVSPTYYQSTKSQYYNNKHTTKQKEVVTEKVSTTTPRSAPTTEKTPDKIYITTTTFANLINSNMNHPSFNENYNDYYDLEAVSSEKIKPSDIYITTKSVNDISLTTPTTTTVKTTTKRVLSLFEQLFGEYDEIVTTTESNRPPPQFINLDEDKNKQKYEYKTVTPSTTSVPTTSSTTTTTTTTARTTTTTTAASVQNSHADPGNYYAYEYEDYSASHEDNIGAESNIAPVNKTNEKSKYDILDIKPNDNKDVETETNMYSSEEEYDNRNMEKSSPTTTKTTTTTTGTTTPATKSTTESPVKVTSLPIGENHISNGNKKSPIVIATQHLREQLNNEKAIPKPFGFNKPVQNAPSSSNVHIAPNQDTVSFVMGQHQNVAGGQYQDTQPKESPYDSNPFRPLYGQKFTNKETLVSYSIHPTADTYENKEIAAVTYKPKIKDVYKPTEKFPEIYKPAKEYPEIAGSALTIQPLRNSEASLAIGVPFSGIKQKPGQVVDEKLEIDDHIDFSKGIGPNKVVFPDESMNSGATMSVNVGANINLNTGTSIKSHSHSYSHPGTVINEAPVISSQQKPQPFSHTPPAPVKNEVLNLNSKPMYHQLPSDLTPPKEQSMVPPPRMDRPRPPWDPRPGHFHSGKPEYVRPPRPDMAYKRIDTLPNILPQFRPNMKKPNMPHHHYDIRLNRQPLLERPSNRPIGFFEKLQPPPPPKNLHNLRKLPVPLKNLEPIRPTTVFNENKAPNEMMRTTTSDDFEMYQTPPKLVIANRRNGDDDIMVETLQMIQAKHIDKKIEEPSLEHLKDNSDKSLYVVYPVNSGSMKLDAADEDRKETVVVGTRAELPLPPSKINQKPAFEPNPIFTSKDRNDGPVLKPHPKPSFPIKSDFPYPLERPDPSILNPAVPDVPSSNGNSLEDPNLKYDIDNKYILSNEWNTIENNVDTLKYEPKNNVQTNQISVTLKTYTDKPIAVAYTPTEPNKKYDKYDKYSLPNYGSQVIPEIRLGTVENTNIGPMSIGRNEFTVNAMMHTHQQGKMDVIKHKIIEEKPFTHSAVYSNHRRDDIDVPNIPMSHDFQAPFQASVSIDSLNQGWTVVRDNRTSTTESPGTTVPVPETSPFDIENFKPMLEGGFKPIYTIPSENDKLKGEASVK